LPSFFDFSENDSRKILQNSLNFYPVSTSADMQGWSNLTDGARLLANALLFRETVETKSSTTTITTMSMTSKGSTLSTTNATMFNKTITSNSTFVSMTTMTIDSSTDVYTSVDLAPTSAVKLPVIAIVGISVAILALMIVFGLALIVVLRRRVGKHSLQANVALKGKLIVSGVVLILIF
jgi:hypothetical protein